jgi:hypothetical protein
MTCTLPISRLTIEAASDARFFELVHDLIDTEKSLAREAGETSEQRAAQRRRFDRIQLMAPFDGMRLPGQSEFRPIECRDLSSGGFSFVVTRRADFDELVVALGQVPFKFFTARVQNQTRLRGGRGYRVGCRFTGRIVET